ncbi:BCCT family transporter [Natroniella acetigena]|uniref:BCCT family transporter n=1 Tax=Natroniella acetigena TaxID=52004 RepID=UPI00200A0F33|nr:BCCT family transporter [Natroniella acetigena]MCK8827299.1 BCCT family transporter [Natroniella acetigena]
MLEKKQETEEGLMPEKVSSLKKGIFIPSFAIIGGAAVLGLVNNQGLTRITNQIFSWSLSNFGWLYQIISVVTLFLVVYLTFSKFGNIRLGGEDAEPQFSFVKWFAMALTGGIATGIVTWGVNEPIIYFGNIYGELDKIGLEPGEPITAIFALARSYYNWTFVPYAMYSLCGLAVAYVYFNRGKSLSVTATLEPLFGEKIQKGIWSSIIDTLSLLAMALGLAASLGAGLALVGAGLEVSYGISQGPIIWLAIVVVITATYSISSILGLKKGIRWLADANAKIYYILLALLFFTGPTVYILRTSTVSLGYWLDNFWQWGLDPGDIGGSALVQWWTLYDWAIWIAYAPLMGLFLAVIAYGRTIREFMIINWILPSFFSVVWFGVLGSTALYWQQEGTVDLIGVIEQSGAVGGLWALLDHIPLGGLFVPAVILALVLSFATAANSMTRTIAALCTEGLKFDEEPAKWHKLLWGISIAAIAYFMVTYAGGEQGVDGVKFLSAAGGSFVLFIFVLQVISTMKMFFIDDIIE